MTVDENPPLSNNAVVTVTGDTDTNESHSAAASTEEINVAGVTASVGVHNNGERTSGDTINGEFDTTTAVTTTITTTTTTTTNNNNNNNNRASSALRNRLLIQQRSNVVLQVLFHHILTSRRRRREEAEALAASATEPPPLPDRVMPILEHEQALESRAICRFCLEGSTVDNGATTTITTSTSNTTTTSSSSVDSTRHGSCTEETSNAPLDYSLSSTSTRTRGTPRLDEKTIPKHALIAPCNCSGGSQWVHLECLRQWQRMQERSLTNTRTGGGGGGGGNNNNNNTYTTYTAAGYTCNVCMSPYLVRPPTIPCVRRHFLKRGTLLVARPNAGRTFQRKIIVLLHTCPQRGAFGLMINSPLPTAGGSGGGGAGGGAADIGTSLSNDNDNNNTEESTGNHTNSNENANTTVSPLSSSLIEWRRGGPVCGGRLGVVHYVVLHTYTTSLDNGPRDSILDVDIDEDYFEDDDHENGNDSDNDGLEEEEAYNALITTEATEMDEDPDGDSLASPTNNDEQDSLEESTTTSSSSSDACALLSLPIFDGSRNTPPLHFLASPATSLPTTFSEDRLEHTIQRLASTATFTSDTNENEHDSSTVPTAAAAAATAATTSHVNSSKVLVFSGYCKWRAGQLEREIQREVWDVCADATPADVFQPIHEGSSLFWDEIRQSDRLLSWQQLVGEEDENVDSDVGGY